jgi:methylthioribulose 1-phosphate dehydratase/enolase-phosphatase E1
MNAQLATLLDTTEEDHVLRLTHLEMLKGVGNHSYECTLEIPIIDNQKAENLLEPDMARAIQDYPKCNAVLVRRHGVYVWGDTWEEAKTRLESFDYLFETAIKMKQMGIDFSLPPLKKTKASTKRLHDEI